ncbi:MAG TPA: hypothetical protein VMU62_08970 [Acidobacteriaceae bacterium]|nr:hypothetical protein [Acidobacteriaceae bacterium]
MTVQPDSVCPHCGVALKAQDKPSAEATAMPTVRKDADREYDHRCILLPRRTSTGGIITPQ